MLFICDGVICAVVYPMISRRRFQQLEVLEGQNILVTISGKKNKIRVYYLSWLKTKILKTDVVSLWRFVRMRGIVFVFVQCVVKKKVVMIALLFLHIGRTSVI